MNRSRVLALISVVAVAATTMWSGPASAAPPAFALHDTGTTGVELTLGVTSTGTIFVGGWDRIARSSDNGATWTKIAPAIAGASVFAADRVLIVDRATDRVFVNDTDLACTVMSYSDDLGASWVTNPAACGGGATDHQKIAVGPRTTLADPTGLAYPNVVYTCANGLSHTPCAASIDGGLTFGPSIPAGFVDTSNDSAVVTCAFQGTPVAASNGTLYQPKTQCGARVDRTTDNGLTWTTRDVSADAPSGDTPDMTVSPDGTLYFIWTKSDWKPYLSRSSDGGETWTTFPIAVSGLTSALFPVVAAGADGHVGIAFYGTTDNPSSWNHNPGDAPASVAWRLYAATITDAAAASPSIAPVVVTSQPVQIGCLSKLGGCGNTNIADYIDAEITPAGRLAIAYTDGCPATCTTAAQSTLEAAVLAIQTGGDLL